MPKNAIRLAGAAVMLLAGLSAGTAGAVELKVVCAGAMRTALQELAPAFEKSSGHKLVIEYGSYVLMRNRIGSGEVADLTINERPVLEDLLKHIEDEGERRALAKSIQSKMIRLDMLKHRSMDLHSVRNYSRKLVAKFQLK